VGEEGRELFTPSQSGNITPNSQMPPAPTEVKQIDKHSFSFAPASAPAMPGGINAAQPPANAPQAPAMAGMGQQGGQPAQGMGQQTDEQARIMAEHRKNRGVQGQEGQVWGIPQGPNTFSQQGMMGQAPQGNNQQAMMQNKAQSQAEATKQFGQAGQVRASWKDGGGLSGFGQGGAIPINRMKHPGGIPQQGGLMGQGQLTPEQQQMAEQKRKQQMAAFGVV